MGFAGAWGPGGFMGGGGGAQRGPGSPVAGLPFAGIPPELQPQVEKLISDEPEWETPEVPFSYAEQDHRPYSLRSLLGAHKPSVALALALVGVETVLLQAGPFVTRIGIDDGMARRDMLTVVGAAVAYLVSLVVGGTATGLRVAWTGRLAQKINYDQRLRVFSHIQRLSLDFFTDEMAGRIMTRMTSDIEATNQMLQNGLIQLFVQGLTIVVITIVLFSMNVMLAAVTVVIVIPTMGVLSAWFGSRSERGYLRVRDWIAAVMADLQESLSGVRVVTSHNRQVHNVVAHRNVVGEYRDANYYTAHLSAVFGPGSQAIGLVGQALLLLVGGLMVIHHRLTVGELTAFVLYLTSFFAPIQQLAQLYNTVQQGRAAITKLSGLLATEPTVAEAPDAQPLPPIHGEIRLEDVTFGYSPDQPVLRNVDLQINAGETFSFVGPTGAGKSTIAKLVTRFYDPSSGRVLIDGHDLRTVTIESLRRQLGVVPQEPFLFAGTIADNVRFARPEATDEEVAEAVRAVGLQELVDRLPDGLETYCHERGVSLSSGERQLIALARAFLARPRVLVLDEATSNLDLASETKVERALDLLLEGRTAILIAHRLSTAMRANRIAVIHDGRVAEVGSHEELVALGGRYADMYATWLSHLNEEASAGAGEAAQ